MTVVSQGAHLHGGLRLLAALLVGYLILGQPVLGACSHARFRRGLGRDPHALLHRYRRTALEQRPGTDTPAVLGRSPPSRKLSEPQCRKAVSPLSRARFPMSRRCLLCRPPETRSCTCMCTLSTRCWTGRPG